MTLRAIWHAIVGKPVAPPLFSPDIERRVLLALTAVEASMALLVEIQRKQQEVAAMLAKQRPGPASREQQSQGKPKLAANAGFRRPPPPDEE